MRDPITYRVVTFDPGANLGICISEMDIDHTYYKPLYAETVDLDRYAEIYLSDLIALHGKRFARCHALRIVVKGILNKWQPEVIAHETAFFNKFRVHAGIVLVEYLLFLRMAAIEYDPFVFIHGYAPFEVKKSVKAKKLSSDKSMITDALPKLPDIDLSLVELDTLDEHSKDSMAVGYCYYDKNRKRNGEDEHSSNRGQAKGKRVSSSRK